MQEYELSGITPLPVFDRTPPLGENFCFTMNVNSTPHGGSPPVAEGGITKKIPRCEQAEIWEKLKKFKKM
ncbi:MAG: hypothetical protein ACLRFP_04985 [Alphaproteobacteria bacterium]